MSGLYILICSLTACHYTDCTPEQNKVQPYGPIMDIPVIHLHSFRIVNVISSAGLPDACNARPNHGIFFEIHAVSWNFLLYDRPGSYEAHFPFQHVPELGQLIEAGLSEEGTALCDAGIVFQLEFFIPFRFGRRIGSQEVLQYFFRVDAHGAEFIAVEFFPIFADTAMLEDDRSRRVVIDPYCDEEKNR